MRVVFAVWGRIFSAKASRSDSESGKKTFDLIAFLLRT